MITTNPTCPTWCTQTHASTEYFEGGTLDCRTVIAQEPGWTVAIWADVDPSNVADPIGARVVADIHRDEVPPAVARQMAAALLRAADLAEGN